MNLSKNCPTSIKQFDAEGVRLTMNLSKEADAAFMRELEREDPERYADLQKNMRRDNPNARISEDQALTNFVLGLPTPGFRFAIVAGVGAPVSVERARVDHLLHHGTADEWAQAIVALADAPEPEYPTRPVDALLATPTKSGARHAYTQGKPGRPRKHKTLAARRRAKAEYQRTFRLKFANGSDVANNWLGPPDSNGLTDRVGPNTHIQPPAS